MTPTVDVVLANKTQYVLFLLVVNINKARFMPLLYYLQAPDIFRLNLSDLTKTSEIGIPNVQNRNRDDLHFDNHFLLFRKDVDQDIRQYPKHSLYNIKCLRIR